MLTEEALPKHCLARPGAWPDHPWDHEQPVVKVGDAPAAVHDSYERVVSRLPRKHRPDGWDRP